MSYHLHRHEKLQAGIRRVAKSQIDKAIGEIESREIDRHKTVHQVRKRCKKLRGLIRLVRPAMKKAYQTENAAFRDAARTLSEIRDAKSIISTYDNVLQRFDDQVDRQSFASVRRELTMRLQAIDDAIIDERLGAMREQMVAAKTRVDDWSLSDKSFQAVAAGMGKTRGRAVKALRDAKKDPTTNKLHELRKRVKYHWYHLRLLRDVWPPATHPLKKVADHLGDSLGDDHDLAVFAETVRNAPEQFGSSDDVRVLEGLIAQHRKLLQLNSLREASFLLAEDTDAFTTRMEACWLLWKDKEIVA